MKILKRRKFWLLILVIISLSNCHTVRQAQFTQLNLGNSNNKNTIEMLFKDSVSKDSLDLKVFDDFVCNYVDTLTMDTTTLWKFYFYKESEITNLEDLKSISEEMHEYSLENDLICAYFQSFDLHLTKTFFNRMYNRSLFYPSDSFAIEENFFVPEGFIVDSIEYCKRLLK